MAATGGAWAMMTCQRKYTYTQSSLFPLGHQPNSHLMHAISSNPTPRTITDTTAANVAPLPHNNPTRLHPNHPTVHWDDTPSTGTVRRKLAASSIRGPGASFMETWPNGAGNRTKNQARKADSNHTRRGRRQAMFCIGTPRKRA